MSYKLPLALIALAIVMLVGCKEPIGIPGNDVRVATVQMESCYVAANVQSGHVDWYQGILGQLYDHYGFGWTITRAHYYLPLRPPLITWPHKSGYCIFTVPYFDASGGIVACTLYYYQTAHSGSASLLVNSWTNPLASWPPSPQNDSTLNLVYWQIWNSNDTVATDITHATDDSCYKLALDGAVAAAIADTAAAHPYDDGWYHTGWVYRGSQDGTYTDVAGYDDGHEPYIERSGTTSKQATLSVSAGGRSRRSPAEARSGTPRGVTREAVRDVGAHGG
jgi:hypothetical protein